VDDDKVNGAAIVQILEPKDGAIFTNPDSILFRARTLDPLGAMTHLDWYAGDKQIGVSILSSSALRIRAPNWCTNFVEESPR